MYNNKPFTLGLDAGTVGRWSRLILGGIVPLISIGTLLATQQPSPRLFLHTILYFVVILGSYLAVHLFLGDRLFARVNPWISTLILVGPPVLLLALGIGPSAFQLALGIYIAVSLIFNFVMSYGGCEVVAIPTLILRRRYVVYCPWNVVDVVDKVIVERQS